MRAAIYARCSTADQKTDLQLDALQDYARRATSRSLRSTSTKV